MAIYYGGSWNYWEDRVWLFKHLGQVLNIETWTNKIGCSLLLTHSDNTPPTWQNQPPD